MINGYLNALQFCLALDTKELLNCVVVLGIVNGLKMMAMTAKAENYC